MSDSMSIVVLPSGPLIARIKERLADMTRSELLIADHLSRRPLDAAFLPAARLSAHVGVSESSVLRFSKTLGYANYPALQLDVQDEIRHRLTRNAPDRLREAVSRAPDETQTLLAALDTDAYNLDVTRQQVDPAEFDHFVRLLSSARRVYTVGMRGAAPVAEMLGYALNLLRPDVIVLTHRADMLADHLAGIGPDDVIIGFAFSRQSVHTISAVDTARRESTPVLAVTDDQLGAIATRADHVLLAAVQSEAFIQSYTAVTALTHALAAAVGKRLQDAAMARLTSMEAAMERDRVFYMEGEG